MSPIRRSSGAASAGAVGVNPQRFVLAAAVAVALAAVWSQRAPAQGTPAYQAEVRLDAFVDERAIHAGLGVTAPLGTYVRYGVVGGLGGGSLGVSGRTDLIARFTLDPFREKRWAPYGVGGVSVRYGGSSTPANLVLLAGIEGPPMGRVAPAIEAGFGGSFRAGIALRQAFPRRR